MPAWMQLLQVGGLVTMTRLTAGSQLAIMLLLQAHCTALLGIIVKFQNTSLQLAHDVILNDRACAC